MVWAKDADRLEAASGSTETGAGPDAPTRKAESRQAGDVGPQTGDKGLIGSRVAR